MALNTGQQNKLLEVKFTGRPTFSRLVGNGGVDAVNREPAMLADSDEELKTAIETLINDDPLRKKAGERRFV